MERRSSEKHEANQHWIAARYSDGGRTVAGNRAKRGQRHKSACRNAARPTASTYIIGADDVLSVNVWKEPDLTSTLPVRADGMISLPLLHDVKAAGLTPMQLATDITEKLKKYLSEPNRAGT